MKYVLSNRQRKELVGGQIHIALPHPIHDIEDYKAWVAGHLDFGPAAQVLSAEPARLTIDPLNKMPGSLAAVLGQIVLDIDREPRWSVEVECIVATIGARGRRRGLRTRSQWPAAVVLDDGTRLPPEAPVDCG